MAINKETTTKHELIYTGKVFDVFTDEINFESGGTAKRDVVIHNGGAGAVVILDGIVWLVRQWRHGADKPLLEITAGKLGIGEDPKQCILREIEEELGLKPKDVISLGSFYPTPAYCSEITHLYLCTQAEPSKQNLDPGEYLDIVKLPLSEALEMAFSGDIPDMKTALALILAAKHYKTT